MSHWDILPSSKMSWEDILYRGRPALQNQKLQPGYCQLYLQWLKCMQPSPPQCNIMP